MATVDDIAEDVRAIGTRITSQFNGFGWSPTQAFSTTIGNPGVLQISPDVVAEYAEIVALRVERVSKTQLEQDGFGRWLGKLAGQLPQVNVAAANQGHYTQLTNALSILQMIDAAIPQLPPKEPQVNWEDLKHQKSLIPRDLSRRLRSIEARITELDPRSKEVAKKIAEIEGAHATAEQLPTDLAELAENRDELSKLIENAQALASKIEEDNSKVSDAKAEVLKSIEEIEQTLNTTMEVADSILKKSEHALRGATAVGLSRAFEARKEALSKAGFWWIVGLAVALIVAVGIGWERVTTLKDVLSGDKSSTVIVVNALLTALGIGAPVWFAWLSTKQIGTTFRLAEDYAFKASVAQAYEGYRTEATQMDDGMRVRLFSAALDRFEEAPIRLVDTTHHSSPLHEVLSNQSLRSALERVPNLAEKLVDLVNTNAAGATAALGSAVRRSRKSTGSDVGEEA